MRYRLVYVPVVDRAIELANATRGVLLVVTPDEVRWARGHEHFTELVELAERSGQPFVVAVAVPCGPPAEWEIVGLVGYAEPGGPVGWFANAVARCVEAAREAATFHHVAQSGPTLDGGVGVLQRGDGDVAFQRAMERSTQIARKSALQVARHGCRQIASDASSQHAWSNSWQAAGGYSSQIARNSAAQIGGVCASQRAESDARQWAGPFSSQQAMYGARQTAGCQSIQAAWHDSVQIAGDGSLQRAGGCSIQVAGSGSTQIAGDTMIQVAGSGSTQMAGRSSVLIAGDNAAQYAGPCSVLVAGRRSVMFVVPPALVRGGEGTILVVESRESGRGFQMALEGGPTSHELVEPGKWLVVTDERFVRLACDDAARHGDQRVRLAARLVRDPPPKAGPLRSGLLEDTSDWSWARGGDKRFR